MSAAVARAVAVALAALAAGAAGHWLVGRAARRLPRALARYRAGGAALPPGPLPLARPIAWLALAARLGLWLAVAVFAARQSPLLARAGAAVARVIEMGVEAPLFRLGAKAYTPVDVVVLPALLGALWLATGALARLARGGAASAAGAAPRDAAVMLARYALVFLGGVVILQAWGVDVTSLAIAASVLGVGIGFGLQSIANNVVSGVLIGLERPIRPGDFVRVGELEGTVQRIGARSTAILTLDRVTILVPNSRFLESEVVNWSHGDPTSRIHVPVGVAYSSDVARVRAALLEAARGHPDVLADPRPEVQLRRFGESSLDFELLVWTADPPSQFVLQSDLNFRVEAALRRHGIQIPFPQRDLHLRSPALERVVAAFAGGPAPAPADARGNGADPSPPPPAPPLAADEHDPARWGEGRVAEVAARLRGPGGVEIRDRRHLLSTHPRSFVGSEAVDWLVRELGLTRGEAVALGRRLVAAGAIHHVLDEHDFRDGGYFYRFRADEAG